jgi:hypothetical protein
MTIADAPLWAQTPNAELVREIPTTAHPEDRVRVAMWHYEGRSFLDIEDAHAITVPQARKIWEALGDLLAIEATQPADVQVTANPWETDVDGSKSRCKTTPKVSTGALTSDGMQLFVHVELFDDVGHPDMPDRSDHPEIVLRDALGHGIELADITSTDAARSLAFALLRAAVVIDQASGASS